MAWLITIGAPGAQVDRTSTIAQDAGVDISLTYNERSTARFATLPGYRPSLRDEVYIYEQDGVTLLFGGVVYQRQTRSILDRVTTEIDCADWSVYGDWIMTDATYSTNPTLQTVLDDLIDDCFGQFGVMLDATDYTGVTLEPFAWSNKLATDALRELSERTGYIWRITPQKVLTLILPGATAAPFNLSDATPHCSTLEWRDSCEKYATKVRVVCGPDAIVATQQTWIADGTTSSWVTDFPAAGGMPTALTVGGVAKTLSGSSAVKAWGFTSVIDGTNVSQGDTVVVGATTYTFKTALTPAANEVLIGASGPASIFNLASAIAADGNTSVYGAGTVANASATAYPFRPTWIKLVALTAGSAGNTITFTESSSVLLCFHEGNIERGFLWGGEDASSAQYGWEASTHTLSVATDPIPAAGTFINLTYTAQFPFTVIADSGAVPIVETYITAPDIVTLQAGQELADATLARLGGTQKSIEFMTLETGLEPGQELSIVLADRHINVPSAFIQTVQIRLVLATWWEYRVLAIEGAEYLGSYLDFWRRTDGGGSGTAVIEGATGSVTVTGNPSPVYLGGSRFHAVRVAS